MITFVEWAKDLSEVPYAEQNAFVFESLRSKKMLHVFGKFFFPHIIKGHAEVPECHVGLITELTSLKDGAIIFPRGFAKTTWEKIDTLHDIVYSLEPVILYVSAVFSDAQFHFESIKAELESNELLIQVYGDLVPPASVLSHKWTNKHFETTNGVNIVARGAGKGRGVNIKNQRPTKIILDDIETDEGVKSPEQRQKLSYWINQVVIPSKDKERGRVKMIGTVLSPMSEILKFYKGHGGIFRKAIENGQSIWPNYWRLQDLYDIRDGYTDADGNFVQGIGTRAFSQEYLNTPINDGTAKIKPQWIENTYYSRLDHPEHLKKVIMFDPQAGEKAGADSFGLVVLGYYSKDPHRYFLEVRAGKASQLEQAALVVKTYQAHKLGCYVVGIEKVLAQVAVYQLVCDWKIGKVNFSDFGVNDKDRNIPLVAVTPEGKDKVARLEMHEAAFEHGHVHLHESMRSFGEKLVSFPEVEHDDDIDAAIYALDWSYKSSVAITENSNYNTRGTIAGNLMDAKF